MTTATVTDPTHESLQQITPEVVDAMVSKHGEACKQRALAGVERVAARWTLSDGDQHAFRDFCLNHFVAEDERLSDLIDRLEIATEQIGGHLYEMHRSLRRWSDLRGEQMSEIDDILATFDPAPDLADQFHRQRLALSLIHI